MDGMDEDESEEEESKLENVRMSNFAYSQTKIGEYLSCYFCCISVGCSILANEFSFWELQEKAKNGGTHIEDDWHTKMIHTLYDISTFATVILGKNEFLIVTFL